MNWGEGEGDGETMRMRHLIESRDRRKKEKLTPLKFCMKIPGR